VEHESEFFDLLLRSCRQIDLNLTDEQAAKFMIYLSQLLQWNRVTNLTSITDPQKIVIKHFVDSLTALVATAFPSQAVVVDVGAGAGFPGLPLKIVRDDLRLILIEPVKKKCSFLSSVAGLLKLSDVSIFPGSLRQYVDQLKYIDADIMVLRALRFDEIKDQAEVVLNKMGKVILYRTQMIEADSIPRGFMIESQDLFSLPMNQGDRVISVLTKRAQA
jgi:16S rRNA (guanine527-N7)-methyltransferase